MSVELKEPLDKLIRTPTSFTKGKNFLSPDKIKIYDDTLRDGEQMPGVAFSPEQKLHLAKMLSDLGVHVMDVAFPAVGESEKKGLQLCLQAQKNGGIRPDIEILAMCRGVASDIDCVLDTVRQIGLSAADVAILILSTTSDLHLKYKLGKVFLKREGKAEKEWLSLPVDFYRAANIKMITSSIRYAREKGFKKIEFASEDASRAHLEYLLEWGRACIEAGGTRLCFSDTVGCFTPEAVDYYFPPIVEITTKKGVELHAHFHNDFGMGALNCVRALSHGASHAGVTMCGIGERAGNAPLEQVVMQLKLLYGVTLPNFRYELLVPIRKLIEDYSGIAIQPHMPIVGEGVFYHESGIHTAGIAINPAIYQFIPESLVGGKQRFVFGKHSGSVAVEEVLKKHETDLKNAGVTVTPQLVQQLLERVKELREEQIRASQTQSLIHAYYENYYSLGISEEQLLNLALKLS
ncbi:MAG: hypothetical protein LHV69_07545 [Elusimicrobia bacterium]|nr:hypothetical protein [Candidatus Obscuribacterium magneticum]